MTNLLIGSSGPISSLVVCKLKQSGSPYIVIGRDLGVRSHSPNSLTDLDLFNTDFNNVFFLLSSLKVDHRHLTESAIHELPEVRAIREFLPLIKFRRLVFFSSAGAVYGPRPGEIVEESDTLKPISSYGVVKAYIERVILFELGRYIEEKTILRIANPFGIYEGALFNYGLLPVLVRNMFRGEPTRIVVPLEYKKDYFPISLLGDVIEAVIRDRFGPGVFNVASGYSRSIKEVCEAISSIVGLSPDIHVSLDNKEIDADSGIISVDRLNRALDLRENNSFEKNLRDLILYIKKDFKGA